MASVWEQGSSISGKPLTLFRTQYYHASFKLLVYGRGCAALKNNQLTIHLIKAEAMLIRKSPFIGPLLPLRFGSGFIHLAESSTCLGLKLDNRRSWSDHICHVTKCFAQKFGALKRMTYLPVRTLQEIYFKTIILSVTYFILSWGNCSTAVLSHLDSVHSRAARIIWPVLSAF